MRRVDEIDRINYLIGGFKRFDGFFYLLLVHLLVKLPKHIVLDSCRYIKP
jgi:hypothetical protein